MNKTKGQTLLFLKDKINNFIIPNFYILKNKVFFSNKEYHLNLIQEKFKNKVIIRSSASDEDNINFSQAGQYLSIKNIDVKNKKTICESITKVFHSYKNSKNIANEEVIIQEMISNVSMSGVLFTHDLNTGAPYYIINYDDVSGNTDTITSGSIYSNRTLQIHRNGLKKLKSKRFKNLIVAVSEIEKVLKNKFLDIEFATDKYDKPILFQARSITTQTHWNRDITQRINISIKQLKKFLKPKFREIPGIIGVSTVFGQMPDWNPIEMLGRVPKPLATSLYQILITDYNWKKGREMMGYKILQNHPLMISLMGQPYIDTRLSFNSFLPKNLPKKISNKLVNFWIEKLKANPHYHDKIEFKIATTSFSFDIENQINSLPESLLTKQEKNIFKLCLLDQFKQFIMKNDKGSIEQANAKIKILENKQKNWMQYPEKKRLYLINTIIEDMQNYGIIPFTILARHGFIAKNLLDSLKTLQILSENDVESFFKSFDTITSKLIKTIKDFQLKKITKTQFMDLFGHLRPGTYNICSTRYDKMEDFMNIISNSSRKLKKTDFELSKHQEKKIRELLDEFQILNFDVNDLFNYIRNSIIGREYSKFIFTKSLSDLLEIISQYGEEIGLNREELSFISIHDILNSLKNVHEESPEIILRKIYNSNLDAHHINLSIRLPQLIHEINSVEIIPFQVSSPNYITNKNITAETSYVSSELNNTNLNNKIVLIENADPGYDWIFSEEIAGLITKFGGANSHMSIRCAEFSIPAAIGCGEQRFEKLKNSQKINLDCSSRSIDPIY